MKRELTKILTRELALELVKEQGNKIIIPDTYTRIGISAFEGTDIIEVIIPQTINIILTSAFYRCENLKKVTINSDNLRKVSVSCFSNCIELESITLPETIEIISENSFNGCGNLTEINIPGNLNKVGINAFLGCNKLKNKIKSKFKKFKTISLWDLI